MITSILADAVVALHFGFIAFVVAGGFLVLRWPRLIWWHLPAFLWGAAISFGGWICPLTPLEQWLLTRGGEQAYSGSFIAHYLLPVIYPAGLTRGVQMSLGLIVIAINAVAYGLLWRLRTKRQPS